MYKGGMASTGHTNLHENASDGSKLWGEDMIIS
jgi:hypothetical protein